jgi:hypothetical protein
MRLRTTIVFFATLLSIQGVPGAFAATPRRSQDQGQDQSQNQSKDQSQDQSKDQSKNPGSGQSQPEPPPASPSQSEPAAQQTPAQESAPAAHSAKKPSPKVVSPGVANSGPPKLVRKKKKTTKTSTQKTAARKTTASSSGKVVIRNGGARDTSPQISPAMSNEQAQHQKENTSQLFSSTDANLKMVGGRQLTAAQQSTVEQIQSYLKQSKEATDAGDLARAHTLAYKAHLLSDELAKH